MGLIHDLQILQQADNLARSGEYSSWWDIEVELRSLGYQMARDLLDNERTRKQLDRRCAEARELGPDV
jgi:hypothetical protein